MLRCSRFAALAIVSCITLACEQSPTAPWRNNGGGNAAVNGTWASDDMGVEITDDAITVAFPFCASGTIVAPFTVREDGTFDVAGTYRIIGTGGQQARWARYVGLINGQRMTMTVLLGDPIGPFSRDVIGPFDLRRGEDLPERPPCPGV